MNVIELGGCAPQPLAYYLKALGILRLVAEQKDPDARGWWANERFLIASSLDRITLAGFLLREYRPTPLVSPWNKGAGFFKPDDPGLAPLERSSALRLEPFRQGIAAARDLLSELAQADAAVRALKDRTKKKRGMTEAQGRKARALKDDSEFKKQLAAANRHFAALKESVIPACRLAWRGPHREWMDAALVLSIEGKALFPALLGTGGNDGNLDFTNNFMQRLGDIFDIEQPDAPDRPGAAALLRAALDGDPVPGLSQDAAIGQYLPGRAGGANSTTGAEGMSLVNPWDFVLMLEGAVLFASHAARRFGTQAPVQAAAPFAVRGRAVGCCSAAAEYGKAGHTDESARGEQWMPLWSQPLCLVELRHLLAEGRAALGSRTVREPLDLARSIARLGVARGISAFERYGYVERNGQSNLAVPLGRFYVPDAAQPRLSLLDDLDGWLPRLRREARAKNAPARLQHAEKRLADALFGVVRHASEPAHWQAALTAMSRVEDVLASGAGFRAGPIPRLQPAWAAAGDDGSSELRLGVALGLATAAVSDFERETWGRVRRHAIPLPATGGGRFNTASEGLRQRLVVGPEVVMSGRDALADCLALVSRRLVEASQRGERHLPLAAASKASAMLGDIALLISGRVDLRRTLRLARAFMAIDDERWSREPCPPPSLAGDSWPDDAWTVLRLALLPWPLDNDRDIGTDPTIVRRLAAGDTSGAVTLARGRLQAKGLFVPFVAATTDAVTARLWAAALAFPITRRTARRLADRLAPTEQKETAHV